VLGALGLLAVPVANLASRRREYHADAYAVRTTGDPGPLASALERLADLNLAERRPPRAVEVLLHSHPSIARRIAAMTAHAPSRSPPVDDLK
jgi:STE24 endopeptidase